MLFIQGYMASVKAYGVMASVRDGRAHPGLLRCVLCVLLQVHAEQLTTTAAATEAVVVAASGVGMGMVATSVSPALLPSGGLAQTQTHAGGLTQVGTYKRFACS